MGKKLHIDRAVFFSHMYVNNIDNKRYNVYFIINYRNNEDEVVKIELADW